MIGAQRLTAALQHVEKCSKLLLLHDNESHDALRASLDLLAREADALKEYIKKARAESAVAHIEQSDVDKIVKRSATFEAKCDDNEKNARKLISLEKKKSKTSRKRRQKRNNSTASNKSSTSVAAVREAPLSTLPQHVTEAHAKPALPPELNASSVIAEDSADGAALARPIFNESILFGLTRSVGKSLSMATQFANARAKLLVEEIAAALVVLNAKDAFRASHQVLTILLK